jgi:hypothetical protein
MQSTTARMKAGNIMLGLLALIAILSPGTLSHNASPTT